jgi:hypothetical protein
VAICRFCGKSAGLFQKAHNECEGQHQQRERLIEHGRQQIVAGIVRAIKNDGAFDGLEKDIAEIEKAFLIPPFERGALLITGWETVVEQVLQDGILTEEEETRLANFRDHFALSQDVLDRNGALTRTAKAAVLREVMNGSVPQRLNLVGQVPINLQKGEQMVWVFSNSKYFEDKTRRQYVGVSRGASVRVMKGFYYRVGEFKGQSIEHTERVHVDTGWVIVTDKNLYFAGPQQSMRIPYAKIVSFQRFSDGIGVMRDTATAKLQLFETGDGWFTYNLVTNLSQL